MKNVLLIGDSIRVGYDKSVKASLEGIANVYFPAENCRFAAYVLRHFTDYMTKVEDRKIDVIHWNAGHWDLLRQFEEEPNTPLEIYKYYIERICKRMRLFYPNAKIIFATSTSVKTEQMDVKIFIRYNDEIKMYNDAAVEIVKKYGMEVNDLYALTCNIPDEARSDYGHFYTKLGTEVITKRVLEYVSAALELDKVPEYKEVMYVGEPFGF